MALPSRWSRSGPPSTPLSGHFPPELDRSPADACCDKLPLAHHLTPITFTRFLEDTLDTTHRPTKIPVARLSDNRVCRSGTNTRLYGRIEHPDRSGAHSG